MVSQKSQKHTNNSKGWGGVGGDGLGWGLAQVQKRKYKGGKEDNSRKGKNSLGKQ